MSLEDFNEITDYGLTAVMGFMPVRKGMDKLEKRFGSTEGFVESLKTGLQLSKIDELADIARSSLTIKSKESIAKFDELTRGKSDEAIEEALVNHAKAAAGERPEKVTKFVSSYKRNRKLIDDIKAKFKNKCQICGFTFMTKSGKYYSEAAHIIPISSGVQGVDSPDNIWVLCANHHRMLDLGAIEATGPSTYSFDSVSKDLIEC